VDYVVAIPSYRRADTLREKSLRVLKEYGIDARRIFVFVANEGERKVYAEALEPGALS
jgi:hypothetical protein